MQILKRLMVVIGVICSVFIALNWPYFKSQVNYYMFPPKAVQEQEVEVIWPSNWISIKSLEISAPLIYIDEDSEQAFQDALQSGVVHYTGTPNVGQRGNAYYFGHSSDLITSPGDYKTVFARLPKIKPGDVIEATDDYGRLYKYQVEKTFVVEPDDTSVLIQDESKRQLTLQTSYPLGTALRRFIVVAQLIQ